MTNTKRSAEFNAVKNDFIATLTKTILNQMVFAKTIFSKVQKEAVRNCMLTEKIRLDGRKMNQIRDIWSEIDYFYSFSWFCYIYKRRNSIFSFCYFGK